MAKYLLSEYKGFKFMISAFEENDLLQVIRLKALNGKAKILQNPQLRNIKTKK